MFIFIIKLVVSFYLLRLQPIGPLNIRFGLKKMLIQYVASPRGRKDK